MYWSIGTCQYTIVYDIIRLIEKIPDKCKNDIDIPDIRLIRPKNLIIYDNLKKKIFFIQNIFKEERINNYKIAGTIEGKIVGKR